MTNQCSTNINLLIRQFHHIPSMMLRFAGHEAGMYICVIFVTLLSTIRLFLISRLVSSTTLELLRTLRRIARSETTTTSLKSSITERRTSYVRSSEGGECDDNELDGSKSMHNEYDSNKEECLHNGGSSHPTSVNEDKGNVVPQATVTADPEDEDASIVIPPSAPTTSSAQGFFRRFWGSKTT